ncbi:MAG: hypothetical protein WDM87_15165 [Terracidiphilus sp.]
MAGGAAVLFLTASILAAEEPTPAALAGFSSYVGQVELRLAEQHRTASGFIAPVNRLRLKNGELVIEQLTPAGGKELSGALLHDWRGTAFVPGATGEDFERIMRGFEAYPRMYSPEVLSARGVAKQGSRYETTMRVRQKHILTVVMDTTYDVTFGQLDGEHGFSISRSTKISEISQAGTAQEHELSSSDEHGFLWRLNSYWSYEESDGGLYIQIESVSLTRSIPVGLGWAIGPFVESVPRESLEFTLRATRDALKK